MEFAAQRLPPGQVKGAPSVGSPGNEDHLLAPQRRQMELLAGEVWQHQFRSPGGREGSTGKGLGAKRPQAHVSIVDDRYAETLRR